jgi:hypothetical protein
LKSFEFSLGRVTPAQFLDHPTTIEIKGNLHRFMDRIKARLILETEYKLRSSVINKV